MSLQNREMDQRLEGWCLVPRRSVNLGHHMGGYAWVVMLQGIKTKTMKPVSNKYENWGKYRQEVFL